MIHIELEHEYTLYKKYKNICQNNKMQTEENLRQWIDSILDSENIF